MRFGLVGSGMIGQIRAKSFKNLPGCDFVGVADLDKDRARSLAIFPQTHVFDDYEQMLASDAVDAIIVSTPPQFHEEMTIAALEAGKHVLCEKPLSNSVVACRRMVETARTTGRTLATGFNQRYFPAIQFVKQTLENGLIGELDHIRAFGGHTGLSEFKAPWMYDKKIMGGGALMDIGIHIIDLTRYLLGDVAEVFGITSCDVWKIDRSEDNGFALMLSPQGKRAILQATWTEWKGYRFFIEAYGERGMVRASYAPMMTTLIYMDKPGGRRHRKFNFYPMTIIEEKLHGWQSTVIKSFQQELTDFVKLCEGKQGIIADGFSGFRAVEIADAVYRSTVEKQMIRLSPGF